MYSPRTGEKLDFSRENVTRKGLRAIGGLALISGIGMIADGLWNQNGEEILGGFGGLGCGAFLALSAGEIAGFFKDDSLTLEILEKEQLN